LSAIEPDRDGISRSPVCSVVVPVFGEAHHLRRVLQRLDDVLRLAGVSYELIVVDDGSTDDSWTILKVEAEVRPSLRALRLTRNFGKEMAVRAGLEMARGEAAVVIDGDLQQPPELIPEMIRRWRAGDVDVVEAVREDRGIEPVTSRLGARLFYALFRRLSGYDLNGATDCKLMDRRVVEAWLSMEERSPFFRAMIAWLGFRHAILRFDTATRVGGASRWSLPNRLRLAATAITAFSSRPLHLVTFGGLGFLVFSVALGVQTLARKLSGSAVSGFTTVILLLLIIGAAVMISLGIIGEYLARIYEEVKRRPHYVVGESIRR
jgi:glycosyltransferase involved in cell wall biosynthesis